jgi:SAM-dependent methyltransferase
MPIPNGFLTKEELKVKELRYPLGTYVCENCSLVQLTHVVPAKIMFKNYLYIPSTSSTMVNHFKTMADELTKELSLTNKDLVIDIGSNDGTMLGFFKENEVTVLGIDPATNLAQVARLRGIESIDDFFTSKLAKKVRKEKGKAKVITATNVVAHIDNLHDLCEGVAELLHNNGVFVTEFPYLADLLDKNEFDTIYHEHLSYFTIRPLVELFKRHNMKIVDIKKLPIHGGSIRVYITKNTSKRKPAKIVQEFVNNELLKKLNTRLPYDDFSRRVAVIKRDLVGYLKKLKKNGKKVVGYGASAKGNVMLNYCNIDTRLLDYIVDSIHYKQGRFTPGTHIPIYPETRLEKDMPDYALLLAWNFADEIIQKQSKDREKGGQFIITIPYLRIE